MLRLWAVIFVFNILGAIAFAAALVYGDLLRPAAFEILFDETATRLEHGFCLSALKGVSWGLDRGAYALTVVASRDNISQVFFIYILAFLVPAGGLTHCIAGSSEVLVGVFTGEAP